MLFCYLKDTILFCYSLLWFISADNRENIEETCANLSPCRTNHHHHIRRRAIDWFSSPSLFSCDVTMKIDRCGLSIDPLVCLWSERKRRSTSRYPPIASYFLFFAVVPSNCIKYWPEDSCIHTLACLFKLIFVSHSHPVGLGLLVTDW